MKFTDENQQTVILTFKDDADEKDGGHVLALPIYEEQLVLTHHQQRGIEFPGGKREVGESSIEALKRELYEETGALAEHIYYIAQYEVQGVHDCFKKDVYVVIVNAIDRDVHYHETMGPILTRSIDAIDEADKSFLLRDSAILRCVERMGALGFYQE